MGESAQITRVPATDIAPRVRPAGTTPRVPPSGTALAASLLAAAIAVAGCGTTAGTPGAAPPSASSSVKSGAPAEPPDDPTPGAGRSSSPEAESGSADGETALPAPDARIPEDATSMAEAIEKTAGALDGAIDDWIADGGPARDRPAEAVVLLALHQQRIYRYAARHPALASRAFRELPSRLAAQARDNTSAIGRLLRLTRPIKGSATFTVQRPRPSSVLLDRFKKAERRFGVEWEVLAAVMFVETKFGRVRSASYAGAQGPMQFMPATWKAYGMGGDIQDPGDAIMGAANYLRASGAPRDYRRALHAYNHSSAYVNAVLLHARQIKRDVRNYYAYYNWQVFVLTTKGERRLTGP